MRLRQSTARLQVPVNERDHVQGPADAPVTLVEYGDFECPHCGAAHPIVQELQAQMGDRMRFAYRHFPLSQMHPHSVAAARAAEAAGLQGSFWEMHDLLFEHQDALEDEDLLAYADTLDLDLDRFAADFRSDAVAEKVSADFRSGVRSGVNGTPTFFVNDVRHDGGYDLPSLLESVEEAAAEAGRS